MYFWEICQELTLVGIYMNFINPCLLRLKKTKLVISKSWVSITLENIAEGKILVEGNKRIEAMGKSNVSALLSPYWNKV